MLQMENLGFKKKREDQKREWTTNLRWRGRFIQTSTDPLLLCRGRYERSPYFTAVNSFFVSAEYYGYVDGCVCKQYQ